MSIPPRLAAKLNQAIGTSAAEDLVSWMDNTRAEHAELRGDIAEVRQELRADIAEVRQEVRALEARMEARFTALQTELVATLGGQIATLATRQELHVVDNKIEKRFSDLLLWSFVFWVGAVTTIAVLFRTLR